MHAGDRVTPGRRSWKPRFAHARAGLLIAAILLPGRSTTAQAISTDSAAPTFTRDIAPLVFEHCAVCHRPGGSAPFSLVTYDDARARARQIVTAVTSRRMPPWKPEAAPMEFEGDRRLSDSQLLLFKRWLDGGAERGRPDDLPPAPSWPDDWQLGPPDLIVHLGAPYQLAPGGPDRLRNFVVPLPISATRYVRAWEFRTTNTRVVHHATLVVDSGGRARKLDADDPDSGYEGLIPFTAQSPEGYFLGWTPGQRAHESRPAIAWRVDPGNDLILMLHMRPTGTREVVDASVALYFSDRPPSRVPVMIRLNRQDLDIPAGATEYVATDSYTLPVDVELYGIQPHAHNLARRIKGSARLPDGSTQTLLSIPDWDFHWQDVYEYREPVSLPAGTQVTMAFTYDNSAANRANPNYPPRRVIFGQRSTDEMGDLWLQVIPKQPADHERLVSDLRRRIVPQNIDGYRKMLETDPDNAALHDDLALLGVESGNLALAVDEFRHSARLRPDSASSRYNLANALLMMKRADEAVDSFREALRLDSGYGLAYQGLGLALSATGRVDEGAAALERAARLLPSSSDVQYNLGVLRQQQGRFADALKAYDEVVRIDGGKRADAHYAAALIYEARGEAAAAVQALRLALAARPEWTAAATELAWLLAVAADSLVRNPEEAVRLATEAVRLGGGHDSRGADVLAAALAAVGRYDDAAAQAQVALELLPADADPSRRDALAARLDLYLKRQPFVLDLPPR